MCHERDIFQFCVARFGCQVTQYTHTETENKVMIFIDYSAPKNKKGGNNMIWTIFSEIAQESIFCVVIEPEFHFVLPDLVARPISGAYQ